MIGSAEPDLPHAEVDLKFCRFATLAKLAWTRFPDGRHCANWVPHTETGDVDPSFLAVARECGFEAPGPYLVQHELLHSLVPEMLFDRPGYTVTMMASQRVPSVAACNAEELIIHLVSRLIADPSHPCPDPRWRDVAARTLELRAGWGW